MASPNTYNFTTGPSPLPDIDALSYNGCTFSPLYETKVSGEVVKDNAGRTTKLMRYTITADGYVTLPDGASNVSNVMTTLYRLLTAHGGELKYGGRGFDLLVNKGGAVDAAWGPVPKLLEFQPLGAGRSAKIQWQVVVQVVVQPLDLQFSTFRTAEIGFVSTRDVETGVSRNLNLAAQLLQLNYETSVSYPEDGYSTISIMGTLEIPLTRQPNQATRTVSTTADTFRPLLEQRILKGIDLGRFRVVHREFKVSRDKRTLEWDFQAEERPYMDLPPNCTVARGQFTAKPARQGMGMVTWLCSLRATYTVRADKPRRTAWEAFLALLRLRMSQAPETIERGKVIASAEISLLGITVGQERRADVKRNMGWLIDFSFDEGLYLDSKTTSFSATWRIVTKFHNIMISSGLWFKVLESPANRKARTEENNFWAISMRDVQRTRSWLPCQLDPSLDVVVDFGSGI